jgi:hypothetical protein
LYYLHVYPRPAIDTSVIRATAESDQSRRMPINPTELAAILVRWAPRPVEAGCTR